MDRKNTYFDKKIDKDIFNNLHFKHGYFIIYHTHIVVHMIHPRMLETTV